VRPAAWVFSGQRFFDDDLRDDDERLEVERLRDPDDFREPDDLRAGTFAPLLRASLSPMAIACFRLVTFRPELLLSVPRLRRRIVDSTFLDADRPYFAMRSLLCVVCMQTPDPPMVQNLRTPEWGQRPARSELALNWL
jgi:hypothetical protein